MREEGVRGRKYAVCVRPSLLLVRRVFYCSERRSFTQVGQVERRGRKSEEEEDAKEVLLPDCRTTHARQGNSVFSDVFCPFPAFSFPPHFVVRNCHLKTGPFREMECRNSRVRDTWEGTERGREGRTTKPATHSLSPSSNYAEFDVTGPRGREPGRSVGPIPSASPLANESRMESIEPRDCRRGFEIH